MQLCEIMYVFIPRVVFWRSEGMYVIYIPVVGADNCHFWITVGLILMTRILLVKAHVLNYVVKSYFD